MVGWSSIPRNNRGRGVLLSEVCDLVDFAQGKLEQLRPIGPVASLGEHWFKIKTKDGGTAKFSKFCLAWDGHKHSFKEAKNKEGGRVAICPFCAINDPMITYLNNVIQRRYQKNKPARLPKPNKEERTLKIVGDYEAYVKVKDSETWTPVKVLRATTSIVAGLQAASLMNTRKTKNGMKTFELTDMDYGSDVDIVCNPKNPPATRYTVQKSKPSALTDEELDYPIWDIFNLIPLPSYSEAKRDADSIKPKLIMEEDSAERSNKKASYYDDEDSQDLPWETLKKKNRHRVSDEEDDEDNQYSAKRKSVKNKASKLDADDIYEEDDEYNDDEAYDDEEEITTKKVTREPERRRRR